MLTRANDARSKSRVKCAKCELLSWPRERQTMLEELHSAIAPVLERGWNGQGGHFRVRTMGTVWLDLDFARSVTASANVEAAKPGF